MSRTEGPASNGNKIILAPGWRIDGQGVVWRQEIPQEATELILARGGEPQTWTAVGIQNRGESGDVKDTEEDNSPSHILKDRELMVWARLSSQGSGTDQSGGVFLL